MHSSWYSRSRIAGVGTACEALGVAVAVAIAYSRRHVVCFTVTLHLARLIRLRGQEMLLSIPHRVSYEEFLD